MYFCIKWRQLCLSFPLFMSDISWLVFQKSLDSKNQSVLKPTLHLVLKPQQPKFRDGDLCPHQGRLLPTSVLCCFFLLLRWLKEQNQPPDFCSGKACVRQNDFPGTASRGPRFCFHLCCFTFPFGAILTTALQSGLRLVLKIQPLSHGIW